MLCSRLHPKQRWRALNRPHARAQEAGLPGSSSLSHPLASRHPLLVGSRSPTGTGPALWLFARSAVTRRARNISSGSCPSRGSCGRLRPNSSKMSVSIRRLLTLCRRLWRFTALSCLRTQTSVLSTPGASPSSRRISSWLVASATRLTATRLGVYHSRPAVQFVLVRHSGVCIKLSLINKSKYCKNRIDIYIKSFKNKTRRARTGEFR
jgi:hypothetical protein